METKLTLRLNESVIQRAKRYAKRHNTSLSKIVENYLDGISSSKRERSSDGITPLVYSLSGVIELPADYDPKTEYSEFLEKKHN